MRRIVFVNRYFAPDMSATSQILSDLAFHLASVGHEVHVVCGDTLYSNDDQRLAREETIGGVSVHRVAGGRFGRSGLAGRAADYLGLYASLRSRLAGLLRADDILVAKTDPPLLTIPLAGLARRKKAAFVPWLQDLYPEVASALGVPMIAGVGGRALAALRDRSLTGATAVVAIGERMRDRLVDRGLDTKTIRVIANWSDDRAIRPVRREDNPLRTSWNLEDKFVVGYSGNLGRAHEYETLIGAAELLKDLEGLAFLFVGGGHHVEKLQQEARERKIEHLFHFRPYQDRSELSQSLSVPDVHWLSLRPELEGLIVPSKFYGIAAAGRAVINVGAHDGEVARLVARHQCGVTIAPGDASSMAAAITRLMEDTGENAGMGVNGRRMLVECYSAARAMAHWEELVDSIR